MTDKKHEGLDSLIDLILDNLIDCIIPDEILVGPEDKADTDSLNKEITSAEGAPARLERAQADAVVRRATNLDLGHARRLLARAKAGDQSAKVTLAAHLGEGSIEGDPKSIMEKLAKLESALRKD